MTGLRRTGGAEGGDRVFSAFNYPSISPCIPRWEPDARQRPAFPRQAGFARSFAAERAERGADFLDEDGWLLERGEVAALRWLVPVAEVGVDFLGPSPGGAEDVLREHRAPDRYLHLVFRPARQLVEALPVQSCR